MRAPLIFVWLLLALTVRGVTPEVGKTRLRNLVKLPTVAFQAEWSFDPERGFALGTGIVDARTEIASLRKQLKDDPSDGELHLSLAALYTSLNDTRNARASWNKAAELFRKRADLQPDNGAQLAGLGAALRGVGKVQEAESVLRRAVSVAPGEWECWVALGRFLDAEARRGILDRPRPAPNPAASPDAADIAPSRPSAAEVALAQKRLGEAGDCFDKAVDLAPHEADTHFRRGMHQCLRRVLLNQISLAGDDEISDPFEGCFTPEILADLQQASRLSPDDHRLIGGTALYEIYVVRARKGQVDWENLSWNALPDKSQVSLRDTIARLDNLAQKSDPHAAAGALEVLGILQGPVLHEPNRSLANLRQALALEPDREQAWEILVATLARAGRYEELLDACEDQVKHKESARTHLLLAKAHERLKQWDDCEAEARLAAELNPDDFGANLSLAALLLKRSRENAESLNESRLWLTRTESALNKVPRTRRTRQQLVELALTRSVYYALTDELDIARQYVKSVLAGEKDNTFARELLSAMDF